MLTLIIIYNLDINQHNISEYIYIFIYLFESKDMKFISREMHIINNLNIKIFIKIDIMKFKDIMLDL